MNNPSSEPNTQVSSNGISREARLTLIGILLGLFLAALDQTIVSTALPKIIADLNGAELYAWVTTAYLLASTVSAPIFGRLTELFSRKAFCWWRLPSSSWARRSRVCRRTCPN